MLLRGVAHIVNYGRGIASETEQYYKEKKEAKLRAGFQSDSADSGQPDENDEDDWTLDDAIDEDGAEESEQRPPSYEAAQEDELLQPSITNELAILEKAHSKAFQVQADAEKELPYPVILPQRR
jgi:hypothetical protein